MKPIEKKDLDFSFGGCFISLAAGICLGVAADRLYTKYHPLNIFKFYQKTDDVPTSDENEKQ